MAKSQFNGELIHFGAVRMRLTGSGNLLTDLHSLDEASHTSTLPTIPMVAATNREPTILANYIDQYGQFQIETTEIDEWFEISKIIIYIRPVATGYPQ